MNLALILSNAKGSTAEIENTYWANLSFRFRSGKNAGKGSDFCSYPDLRHGNVSKHTRTWYIR